MSLLLILRCLGPISGPSKPPSCTQVVHKIEPLFFESESRTELLDISRVLESGGLLIHSALFVLTTFHLFLTTYSAVICRKLPHLQAGVHQTLNLKKQPSLFFVLVEL